MKAVAFLISLCLCACLSVAQSRKEKPQAVQGIYKEAIPKHLSQAEAEQEFTRLARRNALTEAFGIGTISTVDKIYTEWKTKNGISETEDRFFSETEAYSTGRWLTDTRPPECSLSLEDGQQYLTCRVWGKAQRVTKAAITFNARLLKCPEDEQTCGTETLRSGQPFYLFFQTPAAGYLTVFSQYQETVQQLLPYVGMESASLPVKRDTKYFLFSKETPGDLPKHLVTEYEAYTETERSFEKLILVFSENRYNKPGGMQQPDGGRNEMPLQTTSGAFGKWLQRSIALNPGLQVESIYYTIVK